MPPEEVPYSSIALAVFLTVFGITSLVLAWLHFTQLIFGKEQAVSMPVCVMRQLSPSAKGCHNTPHTLACTPDRSRPRQPPLQEIGFTIVGLLTIIPGEHVAQL